MSINFEYDKLEKLFENLLALIGSLFTKEELEEVREFLDVGEYGLALQTILDIINDEKKIVSKSSISIIMSLADLMGISDEVDVDSIQSFD